MATGGRKTQLNVTHSIVRTFNFSDSNITTPGQVIGVIPAGSFLHLCRVFTDTAWNGTVTVALSVGITAGGTQLIAATDVRTAVARVDTNVPIASAGPFLVDTPVFGFVAFGGTIGTAGRSTVIVEYTPNLF